MVCSLEAIVSVCEREMVGASVGVGVIVGV